MSTPPQAGTYMQGRWFCPTCQMLCTGCPPTDLHVITHSCGTIMIRVPSRLEVDDAAH